MKRWSVGRGGGVKRWREGEEVEGGEGEEGEGGVKREE